MRIRVTFFISVPYRDNIWVEIAPPWFFVSSGTKFDVYLFILPTIRHAEG